MSEEQDEVEGTENSEEQDDDDNDALELEGKDEVLESTPLSTEMAGESLSLLCRTGSGMAHAYVRIDIKDKGLTDISILKNYKHIRYVDVSGNSLEDIRCLSFLPHLLSLKADHNRLTTAHLPELKYLQIASFAHNRISSTEGVAHPMLTSLDLSYNKITGLAGLDTNNLPCLRILDLHNNQLENLSGIHIPTLQKLYAASNKITRCDGIQGLHQLTTLHVRENMITSLDGFVPSLGALMYLNLRSNSLENFSDLTKLKCLPLLQTLVLAENPLCEVEEYRVEVCMILRKLLKLDKDDFTEDERADAEELQQQRQQDDAEPADS